jgi:hypothetical protein
MSESEGQAESGNDETDVAVMFEIRRFGSSLSLYS